MAKSYRKVCGKSSLMVFTLLFFLFGQFVEAKMPNDPRYSLQEPFFKKIMVPEAWEYVTSTEKVVVAVIDTGVDTSNSDLKSNIWKNEDELVGNGIDDDKNGFIDDINGWNFVEDNNQVNIPKVNPEDDTGAVTHGTVLAGLLGAAGDNGISGAGVSWKIKMMPIRAINSGGGGSLDTVAKSVNYAVNNGADIIILSFVGELVDYQFNYSIYNAYKKGVLVVSAAGNDGAINGDFSRIKKYPICLDEGENENWILGVGSVDLKDQYSTFSNYGVCVDITAPGENIYSTQKYDPDAGMYRDFDGAWFGSSFSAPLVAGVAAMVKSIHPEWKAKELTEALLRSSDDIENLNPGYVGKIGYGRVNAKKAVELAIASKSNIGILTSNYFAKNNKIFSFDFNKSAEEIFSMTDASVLKIARDDRHFALLLKRGKNFYVRITNEAGVKISEFGLKSFKSNRKFSTPKNIEISRAGDFIVEQKLNSISKIIKYNIHGVKIGELSLSNVLKWTSEGDNLILAQTKKNSVELRLTKWSGDSSIKLRLPGANYVHDLAVGPVWDSKTAVIISVKSGYNYQTLLDLENGSWRTDEIGEIDKKIKWGILINKEGVFVRYNSKIAEEVDARNQLLKSYPIAGIGELN